MKVLTTADWHLGSPRSPVKDGVNLRIEDTKRCLDEMLRVAFEEKPDYVLVSGDIFDTGKVWSDRCCEEINIATHYISNLSKASKQVVVMRGTPNHDGLSQFSVLQKMFTECQNVHIITEPQVLRFKDVDIAVLPGFDRGIYRAKFPGLSKEEENAALTQEISNIILGMKEQCSSDKAGILMAHSTVPGCNMESGQVMMFTQFEPVIPQETLMAADYNLVALGHIHRPQRIGLNPWYYSGAINSLNFNDEGQERGFWVHHFDFGVFGIERMVLTDSQFFKTPIREFITFRFTDTDITAVNLGHIDEVAMNYWRYNGAVQGRIVRILYSCSPENSKALNKAILEKTLLEDGAFMVWEIVADADKIDESVNRAKLTGTTDPEENLIEYLKEKEFPSEKVQELVLKARPVIAEAEAGVTQAANTGIFKPVEISVKNYRNYEEETFNFEDISFCTINGQNGAGKSSLFMDAIVDCLYEEPREGEKTGWIRNDEKARSGSIMFIFRIGEKTFRVTRTRTRSGKITLNISVLHDGEWIDCSKEKANDTQQEILNIIGIDSFTFKSCALIMQDQYGLFLQAKPEERVEVLGTLLGLGVYQLMEKIAADKAKAYGAKNRELKQEVEMHNSTVAGLGNPDEELAVCNAELEEHERNLQIKTAERDKHKLLLTHQQEAVERRNKLLTAVNSLNVKKADAERNRAIQKAIIDSSSLILDERKEIEAKTAEYKNLLKRELELEGESALYSSKKQEAENLAKQAIIEQENIAALEGRVQQKKNELSWAQPTEQDAVVKEKAAEYEYKKKLLDEMQVKAAAYQKAKAEYSESVFRHAEVMKQFEGEVKAAEEKRKVLEKKVEILEESRCVDIENAHCKFLQDAIEAKEQLAGMDGIFVDINARKQCETEKARLVVDEKYSAMHDIGFDATELSVIQSECVKLKPYVAQLETINQRESKIALLEADIKHLQSNILEAEKRLAEVKLKGTEAEQERDRYAKAFKEHSQVLSSIATLEPWLEKEKQLPVEEERKTTAMSRIIEIDTEIACISMEIAEKQAEADKELPAMDTIEKLTGIVVGMNVEVDSINALVKEKQMKIGALQQKAEQISKLKKEIVALQKKQAEYAKETADYDALKVAFSQSGVPHQIIRSIIPQLTATANNILGQMTGGKMAVEFRLERLQKNGKEKCSLDIFIEEYGKAALPYLSKSGGEKVKSSLSVILALAEIKSSSAGIQMGMLQIDEPPFLDSDGTQAYVDALAAIQQRYPDLRVMAITHDQEFKARFPQSVTVYKDEHGSHVRWD